MVKLNVFSNLVNKNNNENQNDNDIFSDVRYIINSCNLITESLKKGSDVMQLADGSVIVTETKTFTYKYSWDEKKGKLVRHREESRSKKQKAYAEAAE